MKRKLLLGGGALLMILAVGLGVVWWWMGQPMYRPGDVRSERNLSASLEPLAQPAAARAGLWQMEPEIELRYLFSASAPAVRRPIGAMAGGPSEGPGGRGTVRGDRLRP